MDSFQDGNFQEFNEVRYIYAKTSGWSANFSEILHRLRFLDFQTFVSAKLNFSEEVELRDEKAITKVTSGILKLIHPNLSITDQELREIVDIAVEFRQTIVDQLHIMDPEFKMKKISYSL